MKDLARRRKLGARVLKAVASALRLNILRLLYERGPMSYTEIMNVLKLSPSRDAGRFAYHLKTLTGMDLIEPDAESRKYVLTDMGKTLVEFADELDNSALKKRLLVRTSRLSIENFDRNKIAESLVREADVPAETAQKVSREAEKRLLKLGAKYLTAPLIREFVNAVLIEHGYEEYRHKLTRLGFPVYDVTLLMKELSTRGADIERVRAAAGSRVVEEYTLLNVLPRDVADAHISGSLNLNELGSWILKPSTLMHDLRVFLKNGLAPRNDALRSFMGPPKNFRSVLSLVAGVLQLASAEVTSEQTIDYFNLFSAPFVKGLSREEAKEDLKLLLGSVNVVVPTGVSLGLETVLPEFLAGVEAVGPGGEAAGVYADYVDESRLVASLVVECLREMGSVKPVFCPSVTVKMRPESFSDPEAERLLLEAHGLAVDGLPYFANLVDEQKVSFGADGSRFADDWRRDWELDTIRTACVDRVALNLPRAAYEAGKDRDRFFKVLAEFTEMGTRALDIKSRAIASRAQEGLLPFLAQRGSKDSYLRLENSTYVLGFVGLNEAVHCLTGKNVYEGEEALRFAEETLALIAKEQKAYTRNRKLRFAVGLTPDLYAARRLAELDVERYGLGEVHLAGGRDHPHYTSLMVVPPEAKLPLDECLRVESRFEAVAPGGHLAKIPLEESEVDAEGLFSTTRRIVQEHRIGLYAFDSPLIFCSSCRRTFRGEQAKCPSCGSVDSVTRFSRQPARYRAI